MNDDLTLRTVAARDELTEVVAQTFGVEQHQARLLTLSILVGLVQLQNAGGPAVQVYERSYHVGEDLLLPHVQTLGSLKDKYKQRYADDPRAAHLLIQQALLARLVPHAPRETDL